MPLKIALRPREKLIINGTTLAASERPVELFLFGEATFLRGREIMHDHEVDCPERALYHALQQAYLNPSPHAQTNLDGSIKTLASLHPDLAEAVSNLAAAGRHYHAMRLCASTFPARGNAAA